MINVAQLARAAYISSRRLAKLKTPRPISNMKCAIPQLISWQTPCAYLMIGTALLTVPRSLGGIINKLLFPPDMRSSLQKRDAKIVDLTVDGKRVLAELKARIGLDKEIFIADCKDQRGKGKKIISGDQSSFSACICMDRSEISKTFDPENSKHFPCKLKLLLQLVQIKHRHRFGKAEQLYCLIAIASIAAGSFGQGRISWLWGMGIGQWAGNCWAGHLNRQICQRNQKMACDEVHQAELPLCIDLLSSGISEKNAGEKAIFFTPFDEWEDEGFSQWHLAQLVERTEMELPDNLMSDEEVILDIEEDRDIEWHFISAPSLDSSQSSSFCEEVGTVNEVEERAIGLE